VKLQVDGFQVAGLDFGLGQINSFLAKLVSDISYLVIYFFIENLGLLHFFRFFDLHLEFQLTFFDKEVLSF